MLRALGILACWLTLGCQPPCREGTVFLTIDFQGQSRTADEIRATISAGGRAGSFVKTSRVPSATDTLEIGFAQGYPRGQRIAVRVEAWQGGEPLGEGSGEALLDQACITLAISIGAASGDAALSDDADGTSGDGGTVDATPRDSLADLLGDGPRPNYMFVTSTTVVPGLLASMGSGDPLAAADAICNARAQAASLPGTFVAWLSTSTVNARDRLKIPGTSMPARGWVRPDGKPFADALISSFEVYYPPRLDEFGNDLVSGMVATGTNISGLGYSSANTCYDWTTTGAGSCTTPGDLTGGNCVWTSSEPDGGCNVHCGSNLRLYCFGVDHSYPLAVLRATGRLIFVSLGTFPPTMRLAQADAICANEAAASSGTFKALLATTSASAASRFAAGSAWVRSDGIPVFSSAADLAAGKLIAPVDHTVGARLCGTFEVWTGAVDPGATGTAIETCDDWSAATSGVFGLAGRSSAAFFNHRSAACTSARHLYCLEE